MLKAGRSNRLSIRVFYHRSYDHESSFWPPLLREELRYPYLYMGDRLAKSVIFVLLGAVASLATILFFVTGENLPDLLVRWGWRPRESGPPITHTPSASASTWESRILNAVVARINGMPHSGVVIESVNVDAGAKTIIKLYARDSAALIKFGQAIRNDPVFLYAEISPVTARPGGNLYDLDATAFVDHARRPGVAEPSAR